MKLSPRRVQGGVRLKDNIKNYFSIINEYNLNGKLKFFQTNIYSCRYIFTDIPIEINVDITSGEIYKISALEGYQGKFRTIKIGMPINDILNSNLGFYYDECEEAFFSKIIEGIALEVSEDAPPFEEAIKMNIKYISVFDPTAFDKYI